MTIYLVRHGQKHLTAGDPGLTEIGIQQAIKTGLYLKQFPITQIISSPFLRTVETAKHIGNQLNIEHSLDDRLVERMNWNDKDVSRKIFLQEWIKATNNREYTPKFGDSSKNTGKRIHYIINEFLSADKHILLVTHGGAILDYLRNTFGDKALSLLKKKYDEGEDFQMMNCSVNKIVIDKEPILELLNYTNHLDSISE